METLDQDKQLTIMDTACHAFRTIGEVLTGELCRPSAVYRPAISMDGSQWCALYGENLQDGVAGFGNSPYEAMRDFDVAWFRESNVQDEGALKKD